MKKMILVCSLLTAMVFTACGNKEADQTPKEQAAAPTVETEAEETEVVGLANPWVDTDAQGIIDALGFGFVVPMDAENVTYRMMKSEGLGEMDFTYANIEMTARMQSIDRFEDISGMFYEKWDVEEPAEIGYVQGYTKRTHDGNKTIDVCLWYDAVPGLMYSLTAEADDLDGFDISAIAIEMFVPMQGDREEFIPSNWMEEKVQKDVFDSYDEVIGNLDKGNGYAYIRVYGCDKDVLAITEATYDNLDGNQASIDASLYLEEDGKVRNIGNVYSYGTAYPIAVEDGIIYAGGNHEYESYFLNDWHAVMLKDCIMEVFDENGNATYYGTLRETNDYDHDVDVPEDPVEGEKLFHEYLSNMVKKKILNFTVVE